jgi:spermidine synthase
MMSDTNMERRSNWQVKDNAHGRVLIAGLGIGMILHPILDPTRAIISRRAGEALQPVEHVTVVELNQDVIDLVAPSLARYGDRVTIVKADIN